MKKGDVVIIAGKPAFFDFFDIDIGAIGEIADVDIWCKRPLYTVLYDSHRFEVLDSPQCSHYFFQKDLIPLHNNVL